MNVAPMPNSNIINKEINYIDNNQSIDNIPIHKSKNDKTNTAVD